jgi:trk system potassium uptake protein TrkA
MRANTRDICVIGMGRFGKSVVQELIRLRRYVFALDIDESKLDSIAPIASEIAVVDASDIIGLQGLGLKRFRTVVIAVSNNITIAATLLELGITHVIAKAENVRQERVLKQIGVNIIIKPEVEAGMRTALIAANDQFIKYSKSVEEIGDGYVIVSTIVKNVK